MPRDYVIPSGSAGTPARPPDVLGNIGEQQIESIYEVHPGDNFGWSQREGPFVFKAGGPSCGVFPVPADDSKYGYTYPVAAFAYNPPPGQPSCRTSGHAVVGGFVYRGSSAPALCGKYIFADFVPGRTFYAEANECIRGLDPPKSMNWRLSSSVTSR